MADPDLRRLQLKLISALPSPLLRAMAGGGVVYQGGRTLDARLQFLASQARGTPPLSNFTPAVARAGAAQTLAPLAGRLEPGVKFENLTVPGPAGSLDARAYLPPVQDPRAAVILFGHFGGGVIGDLETCHVFCSVLAAGARAPVLSVDYRLAPENRFPAALEDMLSAYLWTRENGSRFGAPTGRAAIGGDSMGGNFAAVVCQEMKRLNGPQPDFQLLIYPALDVAGESPSMTTYADAWPLTRAIMEWFMGHYMGSEDSPQDPRLSPLRATELTGLAPAVIIGAGFDPLLDQGRDYAKALRAAGVPVVYRCYDHLAHAFTAFTGAVPAADTACREIAAMVRDQEKAESA